jgi:hypothetical protein
VARAGRKRNAPPGGAEPLTPQRKWRAIAIATVLLVPAFWALIAALVSGSDVAVGGPDPAAAFALGIALIPFVFVVLAFMSQHPRAPAAVVRAMGLTLLVGIPVSALAGDGATGIVAGVGAGGVVALRSDPAHTWRSRAVAVVLAAAYTFVLVRTAGAVTLLAAPALPLTGIGIADHLAERKQERTSAGR